MNAWHTTTYREERHVVRPASTKDVDIAERLFLLREAQGWSQTEVAKRSGVSREAIVLTETGRTFPRLPTLRRLARAFGVSVEEFLNAGEPEKQ